MVEGENSISNRRHRARALRIGGVDAPGFICRVVEQRHRLLMIRFGQQLAYLDESPGAMKVAEFPDLNQLEHSIGIVLIDDVPRAEVPSLGNNSGQLYIKPILLG